MILLKRGSHPRVAIDKVISQRSGQRRAHSDKHVEQCPHEAKKVFDALRKLVVHPLMHPSDPSTS